LAQNQHTPKPSTLIHENTYSKNVKNNRRTLQHLQKKPSQRNPRRTTLPRRKRNSLFGILSWVQNPHPKEPSTLIHENTYSKNVKKKKRV